MLDRRSFLRRSACVGGVGLSGATNIREARSRTSSSSTGSESDGPGRPKVFAFYHPFFGTPEGPTGEFHGWNGVTRLGDFVPGLPLIEKLDEDLASYFKPDPKQLIGTQRPNTYSPQIPSIGLYDTRDAGTLRRHATWAAETGLDGFAYDYVTSDDKTPIAEAPPVASFETMLRVLREDDLPIKLTLLYDGYCWGGYPVEVIVKQLTYMRDTYYGNSHVVHIGDKLPVLLYSPLGKHTIEDWKSIRALLEKRGVRELMLVAGELGPQPEHARLFDGVSSYATCVRNLTEDGVRGFYSHLAKIAKESGGFLGLPISPGFNVRIWARPGTHEPRRGGETYKMGWSLAAEFNPDWYLICSWNEWGEGTQIEPDCDFGTQYLDLTREMVRKYVRKA